MPVLPASGYATRAAQTVDPSFGVPDRYQRINATPDAFGAGIGAALGQMGTALGQAGDIAANTVLRQQQQLNEIEADNNINSLKTIINNKMFGDPDTPGDTGYHGMQGEAAIKQYSSVRKGIEDAIKQHEGNLTNDEQRLRFRRTVLPYQQSVVTQLARHYDTEIKRYDTATTNANITLGLSDAARAANSEDDSGFDSGVGSALVAVAEWGRRTNAPPAEVEAKKRVIMQTAVKEKVQAIAGRDPVKALQYARTNSDHLGDQFPEVEKNLRGGALDALANAFVLNKSPGGSRSSDAVEQFLDLAEHHESGGRNIHQQVVGPGGGYNPSTGTVTGPSSAQGYFQITNTTWREFAPQAGVDTSRYATAMSAPYNVQRAVAKTIVTKSGTQHWTDYNKNLRGAVQLAGLPLSGPIREASNKREPLPPLSAPPGERRQPPGTRYNSRGEAIADANVMNMTPEERANVDASMRAIKSGVRGSFGAKAPIEQTIPTIEQAQTRVKGLIDSGQISAEDGVDLLARVRTRIGLFESQNTAERGALRRQIRNTITALADGRDVEYDVEEYRRLLPPDEFEETVAAHEDAREGGKQVKAVRSSSAADLPKMRAELAADLEDPKAENYARRRNMLKHFDQEVERRRKILSGDDADPSAYALQSNPEVMRRMEGIDPAAPETFAQYAAATLAEQERLGAPPEKRRILPKATAAVEARKLTSLDLAEVNPRRELQARAEAYGDYWPSVVGELVEQGLPATYHVLSSMTLPTQDVAASELAQISKITVEEGGLKKLKTAAGEDKVKDIDAAIEIQLLQLNQSVAWNPKGIDLLNHVSQTAKQLAYLYGSRGVAANEAARLAVDDIIGKKYEFVELGNSVARVPRGIAAEVEAATAKVQRELRVEDLPEIAGNPEMLPAERKAVWMEAIREGGWVTNGNGTAVVLMGRFQNNRFAPIKRVDGSLIEVRFDLAPGIAATVNPMEAYPGLNPGLGR